MPVFPLSPVADALDWNATRSFVHSQRLSDATVNHFQLGAVAGTAGSPPRLHIPLHDAAGRPAGATARAVFDDTPCSECGENVSAFSVAARRRSGDECWGCCPHCEAPKKKARVSWLLSQYPRYLTLRGGSDHGGLYNANRAAPAPPAWPTLNRSPLLLMCEGYLDCWALHEAGFPATVAWMRARPSDRQLDEAARLSVCFSKDETVHHPVGVLCDDDAQGRVTAERVRRGLRDRGVNGGVFCLTEYAGAKDPAQALAQRGAVALAKAVDAARIGGD